MDNLKDILELIHDAEKLKYTYRHCWLSNGRREDTAGHIWRVSLMAVLLHSELKEKIDLQKVLEMIIIHDLVEIHHGDTPAWKSQYGNVFEGEKKALIKLTKKLPRNLKKGILNLWIEFETCKTKEARFARALDKIEGLIQHNEANIKTWTKKEWQFNLTYAQEFNGDNNVIRKLRGLVLKESIKKMSSAKKT